MKIEIPIIGFKRGKIVVDDFYENICRVAKVNFRIMLGRPSKNMEDNAKQFILIKDDIEIKRKYENVKQEILDIYPNRPRKTIYFFEANIDESRLNILTEEELKLVI